MFRSFAFAALLLSAPASPLWALSLPTAEDTYSTLTLAGTPPAVTRTAITAANGNAGTLLVSRTNRAFIQFNVGGTGLPASALTKAVLTLYFPTVAKPGDLTIAPVTSDWAERFTGAAMTEPTFGASSVTIPAAAVAAKQFAMVDVTAIVRQWLTTPSADFGIVLATASDGVARVALGAKEGPGSGYPATLELELATTSDGTLSFFAGGNFTTPRLTLDNNGASVNGNVKLGSSGQLFATGGDENLRLLRSSFNTAGAQVSSELQRLTGTGMTAVKQAVGIYVLIFETSFSDRPTVTAAPIETAATVTVSGLSQAGATLKFTNASGNAVEPQQFGVSVMGPR